MKKILLVGGLRTDPQDLESLDLFSDYVRTTLGVDSATIDTSFLDDLVFNLDHSNFSAYSTSLDRELQDYDIIYIRGPKIRLRSTYAYYLSRYCAAHGITCINDYSLYYPGTKLAQSIYFYELKMPFLQTLYSIDKIAMINQAEKQLGYPFIMKTNVGSHGDSNYVVRDRTTVEEILKNEPDTDFLAQEFCENDRDFRVLVARDQVLVFERRGSSDTHINNTSKGGEAALVDTNDIPAEVVAQSKQLASTLNLMIAGVDIMPRLGTEDYYFLEINSQPQLRTGAFLDEKQQFIRSLLG